MSLLAAFAAFAAYVAITAGARELKATAAAALAVFLITEHHLAKQRTPALAPAHHRQGPRHAHR